LDKRDNIKYSLFAQTNYRLAIYLMQRVHHAVENRLAPQQMRKFSNQVRQESEIKILSEPWKTTLKQQ
jgi:hypothetical protein